MQFRNLYLMPDGTQWVGAPMIGPPPDGGVPGIGGEHRGDGMQAAGAEDGAGVRRLLGGLQARARGQQEQQRQGDGVVVLQAVVEGDRRQAGERRRG